MAIKPRKSKKERKPISVNLVNYFLTGESDPGFEILVLPKKKLRQIWKDVEKEILLDWIKNNPCTRPWMWWEYSAPRWDDPWTGCFYHGKFAEPRQRLGGIGDPNYEFLNYGPHFEYGLPTGWVSTFDTEYYNGNRRDINGKIIPTEYRDGNFKGRAIDPENPPTYESEAAYLLRLDLLTPAEKKHLEKHQELLEPDTIEFEDEDD